MSESFLARFFRERKENDLRALRSLEAHKDHTIAEDHDDVEMECGLFIHKTVVCSCGETVVLDRDMYRWRD